LKLTDGGRARFVRIDLHTHYYPASYFEAIRTAGGDFGFADDPSGATTAIIEFKGSRFFGITPPMTDPLLRLEQMDRVGVTTQVLSLSTPNVNFLEGDHQVALARTVNDDYANLAARHPGRFKGFASVPLDAHPDAAIAEATRAVGELDMQGVVLLSNMRGEYYDAPRFRPFLQAADDLGLCIFVHPMLPSASEPFRDYVLGPIIGFPFDTTLCAARLAYSGVLRDFPRIRWLFGHLGGATPYLFERMDNGWRDMAACREHIDELPSTYLKRCYYDTVTFSPHTLRMVRDQVGVDHLVMGSDFPHLLGNIDRAVSSIEDLPIPTHEKQRIFSGTALSILNNPWVNA
jgi:aminocarboxymuconate-semialdehyde decarboxylase